MQASTHVLTIPGPMLNRGFWLYVWRIKSTDRQYLYVGRTGDNPTPKAAAPFRRMVRHLGDNKNENMLRQHLEKRGVQPEDCESFDMVAYGPIFPEAGDMSTHKEPRNKVAALEKELAEALDGAGYEVLNKVNSRQQIDSSLWSQVYEAFAVQFPKLNRLNS